MTEEQKAELQHPRTALVAWASEELQRKLESIQFAVTLTPAETARILIFLLDLNSREMLREERSR